MTLAQKKKRSKPIKAEEDKALPKIQIL